MCQSNLESNERMESTENKHLVLNNENHVGSSPLPPESSEQGRSSQQDVSSSREAPSTIPTISLTSSDSCVSNYSDYSVDFSPPEGPGLVEGGIEGGHYEPRSKPPNDDVNDSSLLSSEIALQQLDDPKDNQHKGNNGFLSDSPDPNSQDKNNDESDGEILGDADESSPVYEDQYEIWLPPEAENELDNVEHSMADLDEDDDECANGDASEWAMPSSLNTLDEGVRGHRFKEDKQKAIEEVMNGKFKNLVSELLRKVGVENCDSNEENWADTVTLLAWQAASFVKPEAADGKAMDPAGYVKIKCLATASREDSRVIKGLVFKKHAAHKHMATKYKNPRLLLVKGGLEPSPSSAGLSSITSLMAEGEDNLSDLVLNLKACNPNVILVEKSASRDVLKKVLELELTLVLDMKLHRLERVARCTGSSILSSDKPFSEKLKHCESLYFEKVVEEHAIVAEGGKKPCKTLMFLEGCPTRLGCTILLKGSHNEELKKIKCVVQCAVVMAYHFLLETSFLVDQEAMFSTIAYQNIPDNENAISVSSEISTIPHTGEANTNVEVPISDGSVETSSPVAESSVKISSGSHDKQFGEISQGNGISSEVTTSNGLSTVCNDSHMTTLSTASSSIHDILEKVSYVSPTTFEDMSTYIDLDGAQPSEDASENRIIEVKSSDMEEVSPDNDLHSVSSLSAATGEVKGAVDDGDDCIKPKDEISNLLDAESILVLMSSRNASKGTFCEQSHFSHIKFYRHFDVPLGKFLRDNLFKQTVSCKTCNELPEAHLYYYAHHSKQLTIKLKRIEDKKRLPGESEGKLWMWSRCGKCAPSEEKSTKRVLISTAARGLSFGKFLELTFSSHSSFNRMSSCGHSFQKDFLYFFGLGSMVALFRYSRVATYAVSVPSQKLEFHSSINGEWLQKEIETVNAKGILIFTEIANYMKKFESRLSGQKLDLNGSSIGFADVLGMLKFERAEFEENIKNTSIKSENSHNTVHKLLSLNCLRWVILLEACVWERRLQSLISSLSTMPRSTVDVSNDVTQRQLSLSNSGSAGNEADISQTEMPKILQGQTQKVTEEPVHEQVDLPNNRNEGMVKADANSDGETVLNENVSNGNNETSNVTNIEIHIEVEGEEVSLEKCSNEETICTERDLISSPIKDKNLESETSGDSVTNVSQLRDSDLHSNGKIAQNSDILPSESLSEDRSIPIEGDKENVAEDVYERAISPPLSKSDPIAWLWKSFSEIREECMMDLHKSHRPKFGHLPKSVLVHSAGFLPTVSEVIQEEGSRLHITVKDSDYIVSDFDGEISSSVACALAVIKDLTPPASDNDDNATLKRALSEPAPNWAAGGFLDPDVIHSATSMSFADRYPNFDGLNNLDSLVSSGRTHPEVTLGVEKYPMKGKYSVVVIYAHEFRAFREQCCPSELDYITSLSRCQNWDAKGGKSKSLFSKTLDDRLIIKEIKKTEFESFMKFASGYFRHMMDSVKSGNQTCLAKILGIYQVSIRNPKTGRESKHDLMVMENLSFGRNITRQYDLKGALHARFTAGDGTDDVLLDQNFVNDMNASPLYVGQRAKRLLQRAVWNDTTFLHSINVMDYSLLVGVDRKRKELLCGIIDYLRQYTWDKQLETWVKSSLVMPKNVPPTIVSPETYKKRFRKFMDTHFLTVPDHWCSQRSSNPCKLCGVQSGDSLQKLEKREELNGVQAND